MSSLLNLGNVSGGSFAENISGKRLVASRTISSSYYKSRSSYAYYTDMEYVYNGGGIASVKLSAIRTGLVIEVDGVTLTDYGHFIDYRRGYTGSIAVATPDLVYSGCYASSTSVSGKTVTPIYTFYRDYGDVQTGVLIEDPGHYDYLTIPFLDSFKIYRKSYSAYNDTSQNISASIAVWENDD